MSDDLDALAPVAPEAPKPRRKRRAAPDAAAPPRAVPGDMPVRPLGQHAGVFHFLTARGEVAALSAAQLERRSSLVALFTGDPDPLAWLRLIGPPGSARDDGFSPSAAADWLMARCGELPLFDPATPVRGYGTWRGPAGPVAHVGEELHHAGGTVEPAGTIAGGAIWPATHGRAAPAAAPADYEDVRDLLDAMARCWAWGRDTDPDTLIGFVGQALLGEYPHWRTHLYVTGRRGSGKSSLLRVISAMAGGMSAGVKKGSTAAAVRQNSNGQALLRIFDEAEAGSDRGAVEELVALLRLQSDVGGAEVERGTADHSGIRFRLFGAGALGSIIPANMPPQDRSRFVFVTLRQRDACDDPAAAARALADLESEAERLGPALWRRMLDRGAARWDDTFRAYSAFVERLGCETRVADTVAAVLAGWDLMLHDDPVGDVRMEAARVIALPLIADMAAADEEGEGERCLRAILSFPVPKDNGGSTPVHDLVEGLQLGPDMIEADQRLLARLGLRMLPGPRGERRLFVIGAQHPILDRALAGTRWRGGAHRAALSMLPGVIPSPDPTRVAGRKVRGLIVPAALLPGGDE